jgi:hypothetical protein
MDAAVAAVGGVRDRRSVVPKWDPRASPRRRESRQRGLGVCAVVRDHAAARGVGSAAGWVMAWPSASGSESGRCRRPSRGAGRVAVRVGSRCGSGSRSDRSRRPSRGRGRGRSRVAAVALKLSIHLALLEAGAPTWTPTAPPANVASVAVSFATPFKSRVNRSPRRARRS